MKQATVYFGIDVSKARLDLCWLRDQDKGKVKANLNIMNHS